MACHDQPKQSVTELDGYIIAIHVYIIIKTDHNHMGIEEIFSNINYVHTQKWITNQQCYYC